jgi:hypothetical protein
LHAWLAGQHESFDGSSWSGLTQTIDVSELQHTVFPLHACSTPQHVSSPVQTGKSPLQHVAPLLQIAVLSQHPGSLHP